MAAGVCTITRWRLPDNKFGLMMRKTKDPHFNVLVLKKCLASLDDRS